MDPLTSVGAFRTGDAGEEPLAEPAANLLHHR
jgi:hypothetical protein